MATLTETAYRVRQVIKYGSLGSVVILVLWFTGGAAIRYYQARNPAPPPAPTVDFGKLPPIQFPRETGRPGLELELPTGRLPQFPDRMTVYFAPTKRSGFLDPQRATETASKLGFLFKPEQPTETKYVWRKQDRLSSTLEMDIVSGHFWLTRAWQNDPTLLAVTNFISDRQVISDVASFLAQVGLMPGDLRGNERVTYLKAEGDKLVPTISLSEAEFVQVDLFRDEVKVFDEESEKGQIKERYGFYRPDPSKGLVRAVVSGSGKAGTGIVSLDYAYTRVEYGTKGTYPIKTGEQAWEELESGKGLVTSTSPKTGTVKIRRVILGYYDPDGVHKYAMPVYVFLGDQNFVAYVEAVVDSVLIQ